MGNRITGRRLQRIRERVLRRQPLCAVCGIRPATEVDHIEALCKGGAEDAHDDANRQGLCAGCHEQKTAQDLGHKLRQRIGLDGYPVD